MDEKTEDAVSSMIQTVETCKKVVELCIRDVNAQVDNVTDPDVNIIMRALQSKMNLFRDILDSAWEALDVAG